MGPEAGLTLLGFNKNWYPNILFCNEKKLKKIPMILDIEN